MKSAAIDINPKVLFPEDVDNSEEESSSEDDDVIFESNIPQRGNRKQWSIIHKVENKTNFICCAFC